MPEFTLTDYVGTADSMGMRPVRVSSKPSAMLSGKYFTAAHTQEEVLDCYTSDDEDEARRAHALMVIKYSEF